MCIGPKLLPLLSPKSTANSNMKLIFDADLFLTDCLETDAALRSETIAPRSYHAADHAKLFQSLESPMAINTT